MKYFVIFVMAVLLQSQFTDSEDSQVLIVLKHSVCTGNAKYVEKITKPRKPINRTTSISSFDLILKPGVTLDSPIYIHVTTYKKFATQYKPVMVKIKAELCDTIKQMNHPLLKFLDYDDWYINETDSNLFNPCPFKGHRYIRPYYVAPDAIINLVPVGMWRLDIIVTIRKAAEEEVFKIVNYYEITARGIIEF